MFLVIVKLFRYSAFLVLKIFQNCNDDLQIYLTYCKRVIYEECVKAKIGSDFWKRFFA